jgi:hypothetical protein
LEITLDAGPVGCRYSFLHRGKEPGLLVEIPGNNIVTGRSGAVPALEAICARAFSQIPWGRLLTCGRLAIGLDRTRQSERAIANRPQDAILPIARALQY